MEERFMKKILAILLAALMVFSLAACSTSGTPEKADEPQAPAQGEPEAEEEQLEREGRRTVRTAACRKK